MFPSYLYLCRFHLVVDDEEEDEGSSKCSANASLSGPPSTNRPNAGAFTRTNSNGTSSLSRHVVPGILKRRDEYGDDAIIDDISRAALVVPAGVVESDDATSVIHDLTDTFLVVVVVGPDPDDRTRAAYGGISRYAHFPGWNLDVLDRIAFLLRERRRRRALSSFLHRHRQYLHGEREEECDDDDRAGDTSH